MRLRASRSFLAEPSLPPPLEPLRRLSRNLFWTWSTDAAALFERIDPEAWQRLGHNPVKLLQTLPQATFARLAENAGFVEHLARVEADFQRYLSRPPQVIVEGASPRSVIAYFSLEFALTESLPNYSGGLGVLAGDHLKSASDLGIPLVAVGLLYREGYFQQALAPDGWQREEYQRIDLASQPIERLRDAAGGEVFVTVPFDGRTVRIGVWRLDVGKTPLYLLDTDCEGNSEADRAITSHLYGGDIETRIQQELVLGIGGVRALHELGFHPAVCHMNEGHSALLGVDRIRMLMEESGAAFEEARIPISAATVFTTHTAVAAGIDLFPPELVKKYLAGYYGSMGLDERQFLGLGRMKADDDHEPFSMALLGVRLSGFRNGVSELHGHVSRRLWDGAWPQLPEEQIPISSITNGVHLPTWVSHELGEIYDRYVGREWRDDPMTDGWQRIQDVPDAELWAAHERQRERLVHRARREHTDALARRGLSSEAPEAADVLEPGTLTIGFARRFAGYKRATLLFRDPERLAAMIRKADRPIQFIFAGKAHPRDEPAKHLIREVVQFSRRAEFRGRLILLERYDVELARALVQGCDVWLNTPLRPLEASGTSGMKAVANGALHFSVLDGWWAEAYRPGLGWAIGRDTTVDDPEVQDAFDAESLYDQLEHAIAPAFYDRGGDDVPHSWVARMKASISTFAPHFSTQRMVSDYAHNAYTPAARSWQRLRSDGARPARTLAAWLARVRGAWDGIKVLDVSDDAGGSLAPGKPVTVTVQIFVGPLDERDVQVDIVHGQAGTDEGLAPEGLVRSWPGERTDEGVCAYTAAFLPAHGGRIGYAVRVIPAHPDLHNPLDTGLVHWAQEAHT